MPWQGRTQLKIILAAMGLLALVVACSVVTQDVPPEMAGRGYGSFNSRQLVPGEDMDSVQWEGENVLEGDAILADILF